MAIGEIVKGCLGRGGVHVSAVDVNGTNTPSPQSLNSTLANEFDPHQECGLPGWDRTIDNRLIRPFFVYF
jgi:hypothetical protein